MSSSVAGVILAAGRSRRMGEPKALLKVGDETFLDVLAEVLRAGGCDPVLAVVSGDPAPVRRACRLDNVELVINPQPEAGQISSLRCALDARPGVAGWLVVLVDQGRVFAETVRQVRMKLAQAPVVVARHAGRSGHPTAFRCDVVDRLRGPAADQGAHRVVEDLSSLGRLLHVDVNDPGVVRNLNHPKDYQAFLRQAADGDG